MALELVLPRRERRSNRKQQLGDSEDEDDDDDDDNNTNLSAPKRSSSCESHGSNDSGWSGNSGASGLSRRKRRSKVVTMPTTVGINNYSDNGAHDSTHGTTIAPTGTPQLYSDDANNIAHEGTSPLPFPASHPRTLDEFLDSMFMSSSSLRRKNRNARIAGRAQQGPPDAVFSDSATSTKHLHLDDFEARLAVNTASDIRGADSPNQEVAPPPPPPLPYRGSHMSDYASISSEQALTSSTTSTPSSRYTSIDYPWRYWLIFISLGVANSSDAAEILCLSYILSVDNFEETMLHHTAWRAGLLAAMVFLGMLVGGLIVGCCGDWWGRRPMLVLGLTVNAVAGLLSAVAWNVYTLAACRLVAGLGVGATVPPLFALASELSPPSSRGFWVTFVASFWMVGSVYVAVVGWILLGHQAMDEGNSSSSSLPWRTFAAACALPSCIGCLCVRACVPESPRFLLLQGQYDHALHVVERLAESVLYCQHDHDGSNEPDRPPMLTREELVFHYPQPQHDTTDEEQADKTAEQSAEYAEDDTVGSSKLLSSEEKAGDDGHDNHNGSIGLVRTYSFVPVYPRDKLSTSTTTMRSTSSSYHVVCSAFRDFAISASRLYATPSLRAMTLPLQMVWFSLSFGSYGLLTWINTLFEQVHLENVYFNALLFAASNLPGNFLSAYLMDRIGRARLLTGSILAAAVSLLAFAYVAAKLSEHKSNEVDGSTSSSSAAISTSWIVISACSFQCFTTAAWNAIDVVTSELFPTSVRSTGMGVCAATGRIGALLAQLVNGALVAHPVRLLLTAALTLLLGSLTPALLPVQDQTGRPVADY